MNKESKQLELNTVIEGMLSCDDLKGAKEMNRFQPPLFKSGN